jgi:hypothetical protein
MRHLSLGDRIALIEAPGAPAHPHLVVCGRCRAEVTSARAALHDARGVTVPEPSPLFWDHFSARVSERVAASPQPVPGWSAPWRVLVPLAVGVAALVMAVVLDRGPEPHDSPRPAADPVAGSRTPTGPAAGDGQWGVLSQVAGDFDVETLRDSLGASGAGVAEDAVWQLNERERAELAALLQSELQRR